MIRRFLSLLLAVILAVTSLDITAYAVEMENDEAVSTQEVETVDESETIEQTEVLNETDIVKDTEPTENVVITEAQDEIVETVPDQEKVGLQENVNEINNDVSTEETGGKASEVEEEDRNIEDTEIAEEIQSEEIMVGSSAGLNEAMKNKILTLKSEDKYPNGKNWDPYNLGWAGKGDPSECFGFVVTLEGQLFKDYPVSLRSGAHGAIKEGWTCYHVSDTNCNSLVVEPGDVIDSGTHTAMVLSVNNGQIICVQANLVTEEYKNKPRQCPTYNHVFWGDMYNDYHRFFNYNNNNKTLKGIYDRRNGNTIRLWKASEALRKQATGYSETPVASTLNITGQTPPGNGNLQVGSRWTCTGTISSNYIINEVGGYILASNNSTVIYSKTINPNATSYSLKNGAIDIALLFNELPAGTYYYKITAKDTSGKTIAYNVKFTVSNPTPPPTPCSFSGKITSPVNGSTTETSQISVQATATDTYAINSFKISLVAGTYNKTVTANATKSGSVYVCNYNMDLPSYTTYTVTVDALCANGATHRVGANTFTYKKKECNFSGEIISLVYVDAKKSAINIQATAKDTYAIKNFVIKLFWDNTQKTETVQASASGSSYVCNYNIDLPVQTRYGMGVYAVCANGATHEIAGNISFIHDITCPTLSDFKVYEENGDFWYAINANDNIGIANSWIILKDGAEKEKRFECGKDKTTYTGIWSDISGLRTYGKYTITFYAQDYAGNYSYTTLKDVVMAEATTNTKSVSLAVGEEKEVNISVNTLFKTEGKAPTEKTDTGMKATLKPTEPGSSIFRFEWTAKNNAFSTDHDYSIYVYVVPQTPKITKISDAIKGYDIITYEPVAYAKTYELYRKRVGIDADYELYESFADNKSHMITAEHTDKSVAYWYRLRVKAEETTDIQTNEKYYPTSAFSNDVYADKLEESGEDIESSTESDPSLEDPDITDGLYISGLETKTYTGSAIKQDIKVYYNKTLLKEGTDYTLSYKNNINAGNAVLAIKAKGNLTGTVTKSFEIKPREINDTDVIIEDAVYTYDKKVHKGVPQITYQGKILKEKKDFEVTDYGKGDYISAGTYTVKIKGIGNFKGNFDNVQIIIVDKSKSISKATIAKIPVQEYRNGNAVELSDAFIKVTLDKTELIKDTDYTVSYANNINPGKATIMIRGIGKYAGTKKAYFTIKRIPTALAEDMIVNKNSISTAKFKKNGVMPKPRLMSNNNMLTEGKDYVLSYKNNKKIGTGTIIIKGIGSYTGSLELPFSITEKALTNSNMMIRVADVPYTGKPNKYQSNPIITDVDGGVLVKNKDYTIDTYYAGETPLDKTSNPKEGTAITVTIKGKGSYTGTMEATYTLKGISFSQAVIKIAPKFYTGKSVTIDETDIISATIKTGKTKTNLKLGTDYEIVDYSNNLKKGMATITFKGIGNYAGEKKVKFKITPSAISNKSEYVSSPASLTF